MRVMMKIVLIYPYCLEDRLAQDDISAVPMGLYYVGAVLKAHGYQVSLLNWHRMRGRMAEIRAALQDEDPDIVAFSILNANRWGALEIARIAKQLKPEILTVLGGIGATFLWRHFLTHFPQIDLVVCGEGEYTFLELVQSIEDGQDLEMLSSIAGLALRLEGRPFYTGPRPFIENLDKLPMPARYFTFQHLALTRGCPGRCSFCGSPAFWHRKVRSHSVAYFVDQMELLANRGVTFFYVSDDTFTMDGRRVVAVCKEILRRGLKVTWQAISRVNYVSGQILFWMRKAGCIQISYGVESGDHGIRKLLRKDIGDGQIQKAFALTSAHGIMARAYFIYGNPGESRQTIQATCDLMDKIKPLSAVFYILDLFPGTELYTDFKRRTGNDDDIWLQKIEDIMYFQTDPALDQADILSFGRILRRWFNEKLPGYVDSVNLVQEPRLNACHADFLSRLAMTFSHGDYAGQYGRQALGLADSLYRKSLELSPDHRAYWGLSLMAQQKGALEEAVGWAEEGLTHFPQSVELNITLARSWMQMGLYRRAMQQLMPFRERTDVLPYLIACCRGLGEKELMKQFETRLESLHRDNNQV